MQAQDDKSIIAHRHPSVLCALSSFLVNNEIGDLVTDYQLKQNVLFEQIITFRYVITRSFLIFFNTRFVLFNFMDFR